MKSVGIIAEYNPFHNGHLYHLKKIKQQFKDSVTVLVINGAFTQRGDVSILDKWTKTEIALEAGIDLIVELPFPFASASADIFAKGALEIMHHLQVDDLVFGSESNDIEGLKEIATAQLYNSTFSSLIQVYLRMGYNYPTALSLALKEITGKCYNLPNDILGISYIKTIIQQDYNIAFHSIKRTNDYHETNSNDNIASGTAIRKNLLTSNSVAKQVPSFVIPYLPTQIISIEDYFPYCKYKIISEPFLEQYELVDAYLAHKLKEVIYSCPTADMLIQKLKSKNLTYNRLSRMLLYILCGYTKEMARSFQDISYIRILGFNKLGQQYLHTIKKNITIPIISKFKREKHPMLRFEQQITNIYTMVFNYEKQQQIIKAETQMAPIRKE